MEIKFEDLLEAIKPTHVFQNVEKIINVFLTDRNVYKFMNLLNVQVRQETGLFQYLIDDAKIDSIADKTLRETLGKLNNLKLIYGSVIRDSYNKIMRPFFVEAFGYSGDGVHQQTTYLTVARNDDTKLTVEMDFNIALLLAKQTVEVISNMYTRGGNVVDINNFKDFLNKMNEFAQIVTTNPPNDTDEAEKEVAQE